MNAITLTPGLEKGAAKWADASGMTVDDFVRQALAQMIEDLEDIAAAEAALQDYDPATNVSLDQVMRRLGLED